MAALVLPFDLRVVDVVQDWFDTFVRLPTYFRRAGNRAIIRPVTTDRSPTLTVQRSSGRMRRLLKHGRSISMTDQNDAFDSGKAERIYR